MASSGTVIVVTIASCLLLATVDCGGNRTVPAVASGPLFDTAGVERASLAAATPAPSAFTIVGYGGLKAATYTPHASGSTYDYAEDVTIDFSRAVNTASFNAHLTITPTAPWSTYVINYGKRIDLTLRKVPGIVYTIKLAAGITATDGSSIPSATSYTLTTPSNVNVPAPTRVTTGDPYRFGILAHPDGDNLGGPNAAKIAGLIADTGAGFVRIDYASAQIMPTPTTLDFAPSDTIVTLLASRHITVLPILEQYSTAAWQAEGKSYPAIFSTPQLYAAYVTAVVTHLRTSAPQITRVELFNEPNLNGWWTNPNPAYAATNGSATAAYMLAGYAAAKHANPGITVVGPALATGGSEVDPRTFLTAMYAAGCRTGACWDVLSVHPYAWFDPTYTVSPNSSSRWTIYQDLQAIAVAHGDVKPHVMLTEWAFSTANTATGFDPSVQARYLAIGCNLMLADPSVDGITWTSIYATGNDFWSRVALTDTSYHPLPALATLRTFRTP
jgi:hypothetical protein